MADRKCCDDIVRVEESAKAAHKRVDKLESTIESIHEIAISVNAITLEIKALREDFNKVDKRLSELEGKPAKNWESLVKTMITRNCNSYSGLFFSKNANVKGMV